MIHPVFHPTTVILVDPNETFLHTLKLNEDMVYQTFCEPAEVLAYCLEKSAITERVQNCVLCDADPASYSKIIKTVLLNPNRFEAISVIVVDLSVPHLLDVGFIDQLRQTVNNQFIKIVMVTDEAGYDLAVELFNRQKIDKFLLKNEAFLEEKINNAIMEMQQTYFFDLGQTTLSTVSEKITTLLNDAALIDCFSKIMQKLEICEYYLCENTGDFILVDEEGASHILVLRSKSDLSLYAELAKNQGSSSELVRRISIGRMLPFFGVLDSVSANRENWIVNTHSAKKIAGTEDYYYTLISGKKTAILPCIQNITSFAAYRQQNGVRILENTVG